jgi:DNA-3-methyladenine glycosylase II
MIRRLVFIHLLCSVQSYRAVSTLNTFRVCRSSWFTPRVFGFREMSRKRSVTSIKAENSAVDDVRGTEELLKLVESTKLYPKTKGSWYIHEALTHLAAAEPRFVPLFLKYELPSIYLTPDMLSSTNGGMPTHNWEDPPFTVLAQIVVYQQLSGASAASVWRKFLTCFDLTEGKSLTPQHILSAKVEERFDEEGKKKIFINGKISGLSSSKTKYLKALSEAFLDDSALKNLDWTAATDEELYEKLIAVKGFGEWSVHMFMMFSLHRSNVLPLGDLGIRRGLCQLFHYPKGHLEKKENLKTMSALCSSWSPYASFASFYLWKHGSLEMIKQSAADAAGVNISSTSKLNLESFSLPVDAVENQGVTKKSKKGKVDSKAGKPKVEKQVLQLPTNAEVSSELSLEPMKKKKRLSVSRKG